MKKRFAHAAARIAGTCAVAVAGALPLQAHACGSEPLVGEVCIFAFNYCPDGFLPADGRVLSVSQQQTLYALIGNQYGGSYPTTFALPDLRGRVAAGTGISPDRNVRSLTIGQKVGGSTVTLTPLEIAPHVHPATLAAGSVGGTVTLPVTGGTVSGQTISGTVTVNALNGDNPASGAKQVPDANTNTVGKVGSFSAFYPPGTTKVAVPSAHNLTVSGGSISGANASGNVNLPTNTSTTAVTVGQNQGGMPVDITPPTLGMTACIATKGLWPTRPE